MFFSAASTKFLVVKYAILLVLLSRGNNITLEIVFTPEFIHMKKSITVLMFAVTVLFSCKKPNKENPYICTTCVKTPQALAANNVSSKGIYKGVFFGSTGVISFDIQNNSSSVTATLIIDAVTVLFSTSAVPQSGQSYTASFTGIFNNQPASINFSVGANGSSPVITSANIPGHPNIAFSLLKETSANLVECFEGTSKGSTNNIPESGKFNLVLSRSAGTWYALSIDDRSNQNQFQYWNGTISGVSLSCTCPAAISLTGTFSGDQINGQYSDGSPSGGGSGTWTVKRTL